MAEQSNYVQALAAHLEQGMEGLTPGGVAEVVWGVNDRAVAGSRPLTVGRIRQILIESRRVFLLDDNVVFEQSTQARGKRLIPIMFGDELARSAPSHLSNLFHCAMPGKDAPVTYQVPAKLLGEVLNNTATRDELPHIDWYSRRPLFDESFQLCGPGYDADRRVLVHGDDVDPTLWTPPQAAHPLDRLPPGLRRLFQDFCFASPADLVNALDMLLTGLLTNHFVRCGKPCFLLNGNQRGIGKTLLAIVIALILDGDEPPLIHHTEDEDELGKRLGAVIKPGTPFSMLFFDNRKASIGGGLLESLALRPRVSVRRLHHNELMTHLNDFLWVFTANNARATTDMTTRFVLVLLHYDGDVGTRFAGTGVEEEALKRYAYDNRRQILGELMGMVVRWRNVGMPLGAQKHRCQRWAEVVGGVLHVAGLPEFLANQEEVVAEIDEDLQEFGALAEYVVAHNKHGFFAVKGDMLDPDIYGHKAKDWLAIFREAKVCDKELHEAASERLKSSVAGAFLSRRVGPPVPIQAPDKTGRAVIRVQPGRSRTKRYWVEVEWDGDTTTTTASPAPAHVEPVLAAGAPSSAPDLPSGPADPSSPSPGGGNDLDWG